MKYLNKFSFIALFGLLAFISSCKKMVEIDPPKNQVVTLQVFADSVNATAAILGMYIRMIDAAYSPFRFGNGGITVYTGLSSDELYSTRNDATENEFYSNSISRDNGTNQYVLWQDGYTILYQANACLEGLAGNISGISNTYKNQLIGEAKLIRAFIFFNLVNLYGDVPLVTTTDYHVNAILPRASKSAVYQMIISDLLDAQQLLSSNYVTSEKIRPNKYTAQALLARAYLFQGQWANAESTASSILNSGSYSLTTNLNNVFLPASTEAIWQLPPSLSGFQTTEGNKFIPGSTTVLPDYPINIFLLNAFEPGDNRKTNWLNSNTVSGQVYYYPFKYKTKTGNPSEYYMIFRLAEQFLIRAEARAQQNNLTGGISDLNIIRNRAGLPNTTATTQSQLLLAIEHEKQIELFCEWGHRWYDLKRTNRVDGILGVEKAPNWQTTDALFPIPLSQLQLNPFLTQNPGY